MRHDDLLQQIKVASLLGDHVYISAGHVYENPYTLKLLEAEPDLLNTGIVAIGLREECRDFSDLAGVYKLFCLDTLQAQC